MKAGGGWSLLCLVVLTAAPLSAAEPPSDSLPEPLTLEAALKFARPQVPLLLKAEAQRRLAGAAVRESEAIDGLQITAEGRLWAIQPSYRSTDSSNNDSNARLRVYKRLYDSGYAAARREAAERRATASTTGLVDARQRQHLAIIEAFFDVILADLEFARDNEAMSVAFVQYDRAKDRHELGQVSDVDLLELQAAYEEIHRRQATSAVRQRLARSTLAIALGRPGELSSDLQMPQIALPETSGDGDFDLFWQQVEAGHPRLIALRERLEAARKGVAAARRSEGPVLSAGLEASAYNRASGTTHPLGGGLRLSVPLYTGGRREAAVARAEAELTGVQAEWQEALLTLRQQALELWLQKETLRTDYQALQIEGDYRELYLDRSRALYDLEVKTDLGDAMTRISEVRLNTARVLFAWTLNEARMNAMTGKLLENEP